MNYFAHGRLFLHDPYVLAGTAVPDWLNVVNRRCRARSKAARPFLRDKDPYLAKIAAGIVRHHDDDNWFHRTTAFAELSWNFTSIIRDALAHDHGLRPSFLGHILVEVLLDAILIEERPEELTQYYRAMDAIDARLTEAMVARVTTIRPVGLSHFIQRFQSVRFLYDYAEDAKLLYRLNQVLHRVKLSPLESRFQMILADARQLVRGRRSDLLDPSSVEIAKVVTNNEEPQI